MLDLSKRVDAPHVLEPAQGAPPPWYVIGALQARPRRQGRRPCVGA